MAGLTAPPSRMRAPAAAARRTKPSTRSRCWRLMAGPMSVASSLGSPCRSPAARSRKRAVNSPAMGSSISSRVPARHTCPALSYCPTACVTAKSRSASANTSSGDLPPSSRDTGVSCAPAAAAIMRPVAAEPVNATLARSGCATSAAPASVPRPWTTLKAPSGRPASRVTSASRLAVSGAHSGGFATTVFPAASAGAIRQVASMSGAFHGVITAVTPAGAQETCSRWPETSSPAPSSSPSQSAKKRKFRATRGITLRRCERSSEPLSRVSTSDSSSARRSMPSAIACRTAARSAGAIPAQPVNASPAACTAAAASAAPPLAISASGRSSMGDRSVKVPAEATRRPPIQCRVSTDTPATSASLIAIPCARPSRARRHHPAGPAPPRHGRDSRRGRSFGSKLYGLFGTAVKSGPARSCRPGSGRCLVEHPQCPGAGDGLGAVGRAELAEDVADVLFDGVEHHHQLVGYLLVRPARGQQPQHLQLPAAQRLGRLRGRSGAAGRAEGAAGTTRPERRRQAVEVAWRNLTGRRDLPGALGTGKPVEQAGHRCALIGEHAHVALTPRQRERLGQGRQRARLVAYCLPSKRLQRLYLDDAARSLLEGRLGMQALKQPERPTGGALGKQHPRQHEVFALPRPARLVASPQPAPLGPASGGGALAVGEQQPRPPHRHGVEKRYHPWARLNPLGLADRVQRTGRIALRLPDPGQHAKAGGQRAGGGDLPAPRGALGGLVGGGRPLGPPLRAPAQAGR